MAHVAEGCPLYYDAINERGLGMAGLNLQVMQIIKKQCMEKII